MKHYEIDYGSSHAELFCSTDSGEEALKIFGTVANMCFGIRKSITIEPRISLDWGEAPFPMSPLWGSPPPWSPHPDPESLIALSFVGDRYIFDPAHTEADGKTYWRLLDAWGNVCRCLVIGEPDSWCEIHGEST